MRQEDHEFEASLGYKKKKERKNDWMILAKT
jgi:hypothetical protein